MARGDAGFAAGAFVEVHLEGKLFAGLGRGERNEIAIRGPGELSIVRFVPAGEAFNGGQGTLFVQQRVNQRLVRFR